MIGGQVGIADHCTVENGAILGAQRGDPDREDDSRWRYGLGYSGAADRAVQGAVWVDIEAARPGFPNQEARRRP